MSRILVGLLACLGVCGASAPLNAKNSSKSGPQGLPMGFPLQYLPQTTSPSSAFNGSKAELVILQLPFNQTRILASTLSLPLDPGSSPELAVKIEYDPSGSPFKGGQLTASLLAMLYKTWKNINNNPITDKKVAGVFPPFRNILHITEPTLIPGLVLTPREVGLSYCWILRDVMFQHAWPGQIIAGIYDSHDGQLSLAKGVITIENARPGREADATLAKDETTTSIVHVVTLPPSGTNGRLSYNPVIAERSWLQCLQEMIFWVLKNAYSDFVAEVPLPDRTATWVSTLDVTVRGVIVIADGTQNQLTWDHLARCIVNLCGTAATADDWKGARGTQFKKDDRILAWIYVGYGLESMNRVITTGTAVTSL